MRQKLPHNCFWKLYAQWKVPQQEEKSDTGLLHTIHVCRIIATGILFIYYLFGLSLKIFFCTFWVQVLHWVCDMHIFVLFLWFLLNYFCIVWSTVNALSCKSTRVSHHHWLHFHGFFLEIRWCYLCLSIPVIPTLNFRDARPLSLLVWYKHSIEESHRLQVIVGIIRWEFCTQIFTKVTSQACYSRRLIQDNKDERLIIQRAKEQLTFLHRGCTWNFFTC